MVTKNTDQRTFVPETSVKSWKDIRSPYLSLLTDLSDHELGSDLCFFDSIPEAVLEVLPCLNTLVEI